MDLPRWRLAPAALLCTAVRPYENGTNQMQNLNSRIWMLTLFVWNIYYLTAFESAGCECNNIIHPQIGGGLTSAFLL
jgi:hypothetical protein